MNAETTTIVLGVLQEHNRIHKNSVNWDEHDGFIRIWTNSDGFCDDFIINKLCGICTISFHWNGERVVMWVI